MSAFGQGEKLGCVAMLFAMPMAMIARTWTLAMLWAWFVAPLGVPEITVWHALGIDQVRSLVVTSATNPQLEAWVKTLPSDERGRLVFQAAFRIVLMPIMSLGVGYAVHAWGMP